MSATRILQPGEIESFASAAIPRLLLPESGVFRRRAERLRRLAPGHSLGDYLTFVAVIADWQQEALDAWGAPGLPDETTLYHTDRADPPLAPASWDRDPRWLNQVRELAARLAPAAPDQARVVLERIRTSPDDWLETQADALLALDLTHLDIAASPILAAALQVCWTHSALGLDPARLPHPSQSRLCPVCGAHPIVSLVHTGGASDGLRYLVCSLCASRWYLERAKCSNCHNTRQIGYQTIENPESAIRAESCPECRSYLKILYQNLTPDLDPTADDLATLALDWLMSEEGHDRSGVDLLLLQAGSR